MAKDFEGRVAVVTGAASGIGYALCVRLLQLGARVYALDISETGLQQLSEACQHRLDTQLVDVTKQMDVDRCLEGIVSRCGRLDYLFNNAGMLLGGDFENMSMQQWHRIVDINLWGVVYGCQKGYALMMAHGGGHIINTASTAGLVPVAQSTAYATTKHAVVGLSTSLREEGLAHGIRVSVVIPGVTDTGIFRSAVNLKQYNYDAAISRQPFRRQDPMQAAQAILDGVARNQAHIVFPFYNRLLCRLYALSPSLGAWLLRRGRH